MSHLSPVCSVCIANYNGMEVIDDCLRSVLEQEGHIPVGILVHDDASSYGSVAYLRSHYPDVRLIEGPENVGFCAANNRMAAAARGQPCCCSTTTRRFTRRPKPDEPEPKCRVDKAQRIHQSVGTIHLVETLRFFHPTAT